MDVETQIKELLRSKADEADGSSSIPAVTVGRVRRRRIATASGTALLTVAVVAAAVAGIASLRNPSARRLPFEINPTLRGAIKVDGHPLGITAGLGGVWAVTENGVVRIDPANDTVRKMIDLTVKGKKYYTYPRMIAIGDGTVWLVATDDRTNIGPLGGRTTARTFSCTASSIANPSPAPCVEHTLSSEGGSSTFSSQAQPLGSPAPTEGPASPRPVFQQTWSVLRIDPSTDEVTLLTTVTGLRPSDIGIGGGSVWVSGEGIESGAVYRINARTGTLDQTIEDTGPITALDADEAGVVAARLYGGGLPPDAYDIAIYQFDVRSGRRILNHGWTGELRDVAIGEGQSWVAANRSRNGGEASVLRVFPLKNGPSDILSVPEPVRFVVVDGGVVWVTAEDSGNVFWFDPATQKELGRISLPSSAGRIGSFAVGENALWLTGLGDTDTITVFSLTR